jgi:hypothetical protein
MKTASVLQSYVTHVVKSEFGSAESKIIRFSVSKSLICFILKQNNLFQTSKADSDKVT